MTPFIESPHLTVLAQKGDYRLVKASNHEDYQVLLGGTPVAGGGRVLMQRVFNERTSS